MKRILLLAGILTLLAVAGGMAYLSQISRSSGRVDGLKLTSAVRSYTEHLVAEGRPVRGFVSLSELIAHGYLEEADVHGLAGIGVAINLEADESRPGDVLLRAVTPDGGRIVALADGSVQSLRR